MQERLRSAKVKSRIRRAIAVPVVAALATLFIPTSAAYAAVACDPTTTPGTVAITANADGDAITITAVVGAIFVNGVACGAATTTNTDSVTVNVTGAGADGIGTDAQSVTIDVSAGIFGLGLTPEGTGTGRDRIRG